MAEWKSFNRTKTAPTEYRYLVPFTRTLDNKGGKGIAVVAEIIPDKDTSLYINIYYFDEYLRSIKLPHTKTIVESERPAGSSIDDAKKACEDRVDWEINRAIDLMDSPLYYVYQEYAEDIVANQLKNLGEDYKSINVENGLHGTVLSYGNGEAPSKRDWAITGFPIEFELDEE